MSMEKPEYYRQRAEECVRFARWLSDQKAKREKIRLARGWLRMAHRAQRDQNKIPSKIGDLEELMHEFGCTNNYIADYPMNDPKVHRRIGRLISSAVQGQGQL